MIYGLGMKIILNMVKVYNNCEADETPSTTDR